MVVVTESMSISSARRPTSFRVNIPNELGTIFIFVELTAKQPVLLDGRGPVLISRVVVRTPVRLNIARESQQEGDAKAAG
jgi:hypothetical protein